MSAAVNSNGGSGTGSTDDCGVEEVGVNALANIDSDNGVIIVEFSSMNIQ